MKVSRLQFGAYWEYEHRHPARVLQTAQTLESAGQSIGLDICIASEEQRGKVFTGPHATLGREYLAANKNPAKMSALSKFRLELLQNGWYHSLTRGIRFDAALIHYWTTHRLFNLEKGPHAVQDILFPIRIRHRPTKTPC